MPPVHPVSEPPALFRAEPVHRSIPRGRRSLIWDRSSEPSLTNGKPLCGQLQRSWTAQKSKLGDDCLRKSVTTTVPQRVPRTDCADRGELRFDHVIKQASRADGNDASGSVCSTPPQSRRSSRPASGSACAATPWRGRRDAPLRCQHVASGPTENNGPSRRSCVHSHTTSVDATAGASVNSGHGPPSGRDPQGRSVGQRGNGASWWGRPATPSKLSAATGRGHPRPSQAAVRGNRHRRRPVTARDASSGIARSGREHQGQGARCST